MNIYLIGWERRLGRSEIEEGGTGTDFQRTAATAHVICAIQQSCLIRAEAASLEFVRLLC